jgi:hypothetical protein
MFVFGRRRTSGGFDMRRLVLFAFVLSLPLPATAINTLDTTVIIPIIGRFNGVPPSIWRTDVFINNPFTPAVVVTLNFYISGGSTRTKTITVGAFSNVSLPDIVLNTFGQTAAAGQLELTCAAPIEARARIYNQGLAAGEFGQSVPGIGLTFLRKQGLITGLSGINGNRVNIGIANPNATAITGNLFIDDKDHNVLYSSDPLTLQPHETVQINDIFSRFGITPRADVQVQFHTFDTIFYLYASEVRNDTGDAIFLFGTAPNT